MNESLSIFQSLADSTRQRILKLLLKNALSVNEICKHFPITQPSISHHLALLRKSGLVLTKRQGRTIYYSLHKEAFAKHAIPILKEIGLL